MTHADEQSRPEPPLAGDETATLLGALERQRRYVAWKCGGLDAVGLRATLGPSTITLGGLLKHLALVEDNWIQVRFLGLPEREPWASAPWDNDRDWEFHTALNDAPDDLRALYQEASERSRQGIATASLSDLSVGADREGRHWNLRWILTHLIEETARHNGHADLLREAIDGLIGE